MSENDFECPKNEFDDADIESFASELMKAIYDISKKHTIKCFPAQIAVPVVMLHRTLKRWEEHRLQK